jgi:membrane protein
MSKPLLLPAVFRQTLTAFARDNASRFGAALAFYIVFSIAPTLLMAISVAGVVFGREAAEREILTRIGSIFGTAAATAITEMVKDAAGPTIGWLANSLGLLTLMFGVAGVYRQIDDALHTIWGAGRPRIRGTLNAIRGRIVSMSLVVAVGAWLLVLVMADAAIAVTGKYAATRLIGGELLWQTVQLAVSTAVLTLLFATLFRYLPHTRVPWRDVGVGAVSTALLFVLGKLGLGLYLGKAAVGSRYGAAGSIVVVLVWAYWSAQIFFFGLELTHEYAVRRGDLDHHRSPAKS